MAETGNDQDVPIEQLKMGDRIGAGGQGEVFRVRNRPGEVFKRYLPQKINEDALAALVQFPDSLNNSQQEALRRQSAWPLARVTNGPRVVGFLMKEVPAEFVGHTAAGPKLRELQYLLYPPKPLWGRIRPLDAAGRIEVARGFIRLFHILQDHSVVVGDISMRNLLWSPGEVYPAKIHLIDCDGSRRSGERPVLPQTETPDWDDPKTPPTGPDVDTDRYKLALLVGRVLAANAEVRPGKALHLVPDVPQDVAEAVGELFQEAAGSYGSRPDLACWDRALHGRRTIAVGPRPPVRRTPKGSMRKADLDGRAERASIPLQPHRDTT